MAVGPKLGATVGVFVGEYVGVTDGQGAKSKKQVEKRQLALIDRFAAGKRFKTDRVLSGISMEPPKIPRGFLGGGSRFFFKLKCSQTN